MKADVRSGTWNVKNLYRSGSLKTVARGLAKYRLDLVGVQGIRWYKEGTERQRSVLFVRKTKLRAPIKREFFNFLEY